MTLFGKEKLVHFIKKKRSFQAQTKFNEDSLNYFKVFGKVFVWKGPLEVLGWKCAQFQIGAPLWHHYADTEAPSEPLIYGGHERLEWNDVSNAL